MPSSSQTESKEKASWDEINTGIFLGVLIEEIDAGSRQGGHFTKMAWVSIVKKFVDMSGCQFTQRQLKNKWDNMKKDFTIWEKLTHEEAKLGYDRTTNRIVVDPVWWRQKLQEKPEYRRFRTHGPIHLNMQEKVFKGIVATGNMEHVLEDDPLLGKGITIEDFNEVSEVPNAVDIGNASDTIASPINSMDSAGKMNVKKRRRSRCTSTRPSANIVNFNMLDLINQMKPESVNSIQPDEMEKAITYTQAIQMLRSLPWIEISSPYFISAVLLLEDRVKRIAFANIVDLGEQVVKDWIKAQRG